MFTGIIEDIGEIVNKTKKNMSYELTIKTSLDLNLVKPGDSIAIDGMCLTVTDILIEKNLFTVDAVSETIGKTTVSEWKPGSTVNLERALQFGGRLDGHLVSGHIDGTGKVVRILKKGNQTSIIILIPDILKKYIVKKGSIAINGVSLTVANITGLKIEVAVIPFTLNHTSLKSLRSGSIVNIEGDLMGKYIFEFMKNRRV